MTNPPPPPTLPSRIRGSLYGLAVTDALGGPVEFHRRGTFTPISDLQPNTNFNLPAGAWTDDTSMMLCLAQSLIESQKKKKFDGGDGGDGEGGFDARDQVRKYLRWLDTGYLSSVGYCFDVGNATSVALGIWRGVLDKEERGEGKEEGREKEGGGGGGGGGGDDLQDGQVLIDRALKHEVHCGNGSLMRVAPIGLIYHSDPALALHNAERSSKLTHPHQTNTEACQLYTTLLTLTLSLSSIPPSPSPSSSPPSKSLLTSSLQTFVLHLPSSSVIRSLFSKYTAEPASWCAVPASQIRSSGFVAATLEAALWAFFTTDTFRQGALRAVNLGDDADTVSAVYGGLAGAWYGVENVPEEWIAGLLRKEEVLDPVVEGVVKLGLGGVGGGGEGE